MTEWIDAWQTRPTLFEAVIVPHRSLSPTGLRWLILVICGLCGLTALRFWLIGAWPVAAFSVLEVGLAVVLLRINAGRARASEMILLTDRALRVVRTSASGRRQERTLAADLAECGAGGDAGARSRDWFSPRGTCGRRSATTLGEAERRDLALALKEALHRARNPRFYNPQLC